MASDNDQQEIVLGNKQLLSIFFIVVAMIGVAFTVGYMVGRGNGSGSGSGQPKQPVVTLPPPADTTPSATRDVATPERSKPEASAPDQTAPAASAPVAQPPVADAGTRPAAQEKTAEPAPEPASNGASAPVGPYLQVAALKRPDADHIVKVLRDRGFPALLGESPKPGFFRVLVGPFKDSPSLADSKAKLRLAGFDPIIAR